MFIPVAQAQMIRIVTVCMMGLAALGTAGCGELEPMIEPEVADLQLTVDTLKATVRDTQRTVTELRAELEARRQELAEAQVARAQLEGRVREAERRIADSRNVIDLQREELAAVRSERERLSRSSLQLHSHMKQLQKQFARTGKPAEGTQDPASSPAPANTPVRKAHKPVTVPAQAEYPSMLPEGFKGLGKPAGMVQTLANGDVSPERHPKPAASKHVSVRPGDTLWSIARKYRATLEQLRTLNQLPDNRIVVGQALQLPNDRLREDSGTERVTSKP